jgi:GDP-L-fucose synthase
MNWIPTFKPDLKEPVYVAGHRGLVGSALVRQLGSYGFTNIIIAGREELDLTNQAAVHQFFSDKRPQYVFLAAAKVGGIVANDKLSGAFIRDNLAIQCNVIESARHYEVSKLIFFGSACAYPKFATCPIPESILLKGELEPTNRAYAIAKIAGIEMCAAYHKQYGCDFRALMPTNLYGIGDHYDLDHSHVIPGMIHRFHLAKILGKEEVVLWGTGLPTREFLYADDLAKAAIMWLYNYGNGGDTLLNVGSGVEVELAQLAKTIARVVGFRGQIKWDSSKPDGTPRRFLDSSKIFESDWRPETSLEMGLRLAYADFLARKI